jgi:hypothetical protein
LSPGGATAPLHPYLARHEIELVVKRCHRFHRQLEESRGRLNAFSRGIHVGQRLQRNHLLAGDAALAGQALKTLPPRRKAVAVRDTVDRHEADIVALPGHARLRIAQAYPEQHGTERSC